LTIAHLAEQEVFMVKITNDTYEQNYNRLQGFPTAEAAQAKELHEKYSSIFAIADSEESASAKLFALAPHMAALKEDDAKWQEVLKKNGILQEAKRNESGKIKQNITFLQYHSNDYKSELLSLMDNASKEIEIYETGLRTKHMMTPEIQANLVKWKQDIANAKQVLTDNKEIVLGAISDEKKFAAINDGVAAVQASLIGYINFLVIAKEKTPEITNNNKQTADKFIAIVNMRQMQGAVLDQYKNSFPEVAQYLEPKNIAGLKDLLAQQEIKLHEIAQEQLAVNAYSGFLGDLVNNFGRVMGECTKTFKTLLTEGITLEQLATYSKAEPAILAELKLGTLFGFLPSDIAENIFSNAKYTKGLEEQVTANDLEVIVKIAKAIPEFANLLTAKINFKLNPALAEAVQGKTTNLSINDIVTLNSAFNQLVNPSNKKGTLRQVVNLFKDSKMDNKKFIELFNAKTRIKLDKTKLDAMIESAKSVPVMHGQQIYSAKAVQKAVKTNKSTEVAAAGTGQENFVKIFFDYMDSRDKWSHLKSELVLLTNSLSQGVYQPKTAKCVMDLLGMLSKIDHADHRITQVKNFIDSNFGAKKGKQAEAFTTLKSLAEEALAICKNNQRVGNALFDINQQAAVLRKEVAQQGFQITLRQLNIKLSAILSPGIFDNEPKFIKQIIYFLQVLQDSIPSVRAVKIDKLLGEIDAGLINGVRAENIGEIANLLKTLSEYEGSASFKQDDHDFLELQRLAAITGLGNNLVFTLLHKAISTSNASPNKLKELVEEINMAMQGHSKISDDELLQKIKATLNVKDTNNELAMIIVEKHRQEIIRGVTFARLLQIHDHSIYQDAKYKSYQINLEGLTYKEVAELMHATDPAEKISFKGVSLDEREISVEDMDPKALDEKQAYAGQQGVLNDFVKHRKQELQAALKASDLNKLKRAAIEKELAALEAPKRSANTQAFAGLEQIQIKSYQRDIFNDSDGLAFRKFPVEFLRQLAEANPNLHMRGLSRGVAEVMSPNAKHQIKDIHFVVNINRYVDEQNTRNDKVNLDNLSKDLKKMGLKDLTANDCEVIAKGKQDTLLGEVQTKKIVAHTMQDNLMNIRTKLKVLNKLFRPGYNNRNSDTFAANFQQQSMEMLQTLKNLAEVKTTVEQLAKLNKNELNHAVDVGGLTGKAAQEAAHAQVSAWKKALKIGSFKEELKEALGMRELSLLGLQKKLEENCLAQFKARVDYLTKQSEKILHEVEKRWQQSKVDPHKVEQLLEKAKVVHAELQQLRQACGRLPVAGVEIPDLPLFHKMQRIIIKAEQAAGIKVNLDADQNKGELIRHESFELLDKPARLQAKVEHRAPDKQVIANMLGLGNSNAELQQAKAEHPENEQEVAAKNIQLRS
jgi:hypothetical protein